MYPAAFEYLAARSFEEAVDALMRLGSGAKILAGGASLIPLMKLRLAEPTHLIDINTVPDAAFIREGAGVLAIGALAREVDVEESAIVRERLPILVDTTAVIADPIVRNMGTVAGNLAHGDPANDHPATMVALGASLVLLGPGGRRELPVAEFFLGLFETAADPAEVIVEIRIPLPSAATGGAYVKLERQVGDYALAGAAAVVRLESDGTIGAARLVLTNAGATPIRATGAEPLLEGTRPTAAVLRDAAAAASADIEPWADLRGSSAFKARLAGVAASRALRTAIHRAGGTVHD
jgi:carbon-monoxide dehydrogenase medium subunit